MLPARRLRQRHSARMQRGSRRSPGAHGVNGPPALRRSHGARARPPPLAQRTARLLRGRPAIRRAQRRGWRASPAAPSGARLEWFVRIQASRTTNSTAICVGSRRHSPLPAAHGSNGSCAFAATRTTNFTATAWAAAAIRHPQRPTAGWSARPPPLAAAHSLNGFVRTRCHSHNTLHGYCVGRPPFATRSGAQRGWSVRHPRSHDARCGWGVGSRRHALLAAGCPRARPLFAASSGTTWMRPPSARPRDWAKAEGRRASRPRSWGAPAFGRACGP